MNTKDRDVRIKHRKAKERRRLNRIESLKNAKKKTLQTMYEEGGLPRALFSKLGL